MSTRKIMSATAFMATIFCGTFLTIAAVASTGHDQPAVQGSAGIFQVSTLLGTSVINPSGLKLGQVKDVLLDSQAGQATFVVIDAAAPGTEQAVLVVPYQAMRLGMQSANNRQIVVLDLRPDQLHAAPQIRNSQWQLLKDPFFLQQAREFYQVRTYTTARPIDETVMVPPPPAQNVAPQPCINSTNASSDLPQDLEDFYNE